jgi:hypothetical protein
VGFYYAPVVRGASAYTPVIRAKFIRRLNEAKVCLCRVYVRYLAEGLLREYQMKLSPPVPEPGAATDGDEDAIW